MAMKFVRLVWAYTFFVLFPGLAVGGMGLAWVLMRVRSDLMKLLILLGGGALLSLVLGGVPIWLIVLYSKKGKVVHVKAKTSTSKLGFFRSIDTDLGQLFVFPAMYHKIQEDKTYKMRVLIDVVSEFEEVP
jgi:hypothetical protein